MRYPHLRWPRALAGTLVLSVALGACKDDPAQPQITIEDYFTAVAAVTGTGSVSAEFVAGGTPQSGSGPAANVEMESALVPGGSALIGVSAGTAFNTVIIAIPGVDGYYRLTLSQPVTQATLAAIASASLPSQTFQVQAGVGSGGIVGAYATVPVVVASTGTGIIQASVTWDTDADVDLYVLLPDGEYIYYGNKSAQGGQLDLDSNVVCTVTQPRNAENITFASQAPRGQYQVLVDYWSSCGASATNYAVTVRVQGQQTRVFTGTFTGQYTDEPRHIYTFTY
jgi:hypothetical protein